MSPSKQSFITLLLYASSLLLPLSGSALLIYLAAHYPNILQGFSIIQWITFYLIITVAMAFALIPTSMVAGFTGFALGLYGLPCIVGSYMAAAIGSWFLVKYLPNHALVDKLKASPAIAKLLYSLQNKNNTAIVLFARISPILPFVTMNLVLAGSGVNFRHYCWGSLGGMLPRTILLVWVGAQAQVLQQAINNNNSETIKSVLTLLTIVSLLGLGYYAFKYLKNDKKEEEI